MDRRTTWGCGIVVFAVALYGCQLLSGLSSLDDQASDGGEADSDATSTGDGSTTPIDDSSTPNDDGGTTPIDDGSAPSDASPSDADADVEADADADADADVDASDGGVTCLPNEHRVNVSVTLLGGATLESLARDGINAGATRTFCVADAGSITLTATSGSAAQFAFFRGPCVNATTPQCALTNVTADSDVTLTVTADNIVFITSETYLGDLGGLAGADAKCQTLAQNAGLPGTYRAWLSTGTTTAVSRLSGFRGWRRVDGLPFADSPGTLPATTFYPARITELGTAVGGQVRIGPFPGPTPGNCTCGDWMSSTYNNTDCVVGDPTATADSWTNGQSSRDCSIGLRHYCFGVDRSHEVKVDPIPANGRRIFVSSVYTVGSRTPDEQCALDGANWYAGQGRTFKALVGEVGKTAVSRAGITYGPGTAGWYRHDNVLVFPAPTVAAEPNLEPIAAIHMMGNGTRVGRATRAYTGLSGPTNNVTPDSGTCTNWTVADSTTTTLGSINAGAGAAWRNANTGACTANLSVYCIEP